MNTDIDDRKRAEEELRQSDKRKDEFLAMLAHELRNPLAPMRTAMEIYKKLLPDEPEIQRVREMNERQVHHLSRLVDDLLDIARIKSGRIELRMQRLDLRVIVSTAIANTEATIRARHHELSVNQDTQALMIEGDEMRLVQIVTNLLDNAIKYTPVGGRLGIASQRDGEHAEIRVTDDGIGLDPEMQSHAFDMFARGVRDSSTPSDGLGLGLTLVQRLTQMHGGTVEARSEAAGQGSKFIMRLPLSEARVDETQAVSDPAEPKDPATACVPKRILVVDDNHDAADSLALMLEITGTRSARPTTGAAHWRWRRN